MQNDPEAVPASPRNPGAAERALETLILSSRWLLVPIYIALCLFLIAFGVKSVQELVHILGHITEITESELVLGVLSVIDMTLVASLLVMVALSGYETFVSRFDTIGDVEKPSWLGKLDPGTVKIKLAVSIVSISAIHLLRTYLSSGSLTNAQLLTAAAVHLAFVISALILAYVDRLAFSHHR